MVLPEDLAAHHRRVLEEESAISAEIIAARGYRTVTVKAELRRRGFADYQLLVPSLLLPIYNVHGEIAGYQSRPDSPRIDRRGKAVKYETPAGMKMAIDVHPSQRSFLSDPNVPLWITEGIKKGDALCSHGCCAVAVLGVWNWRGTNESGGKTVLADFESIALNGRRIFLVFDSDVMTKPAVHAALGRFKAFLESRSAHVLVVYLVAGRSGAKVGVDDFLATGGTVDDLVALASEDLRRGPDEPEDAAQSDANEGQSQATMLVKLADAADLFHDEHGDAYAAFEESGHRETWAVRSGGFRRWLARSFYTKFNKAPNGAALADALTVIEGEAQFEGDERTVATRLARGPDGAVYIDLGTPDWHAIRVTASGWDIVDGLDGLDGGSVHFRRSPTLAALALPVAGGSIQALRRLINVGSEEDFVLLVGWLVGALRPNGPYAVLAFVAEQGSGKSLAARFLRSLVDPSSVPLRGMPREERDLVIAAKGNNVVALDNVANLAQWLSDALCRMATGAGWATRRLYTDAEEEIFNQSRPVLITGIEDYVTNGDLLDRTILVGLPTIPPTQRRQETELVAEFNELQPQILGALLDGVSAALRNLPNVRPPALPRMADFATWVIAAEEAFGWPAGTFLAAYSEGANAANDVVLDASLIAEPVRQLAAKAGQDGWTGTASQLLDALRAMVTEEIKKSKGWPTTGRAVSGMLRRLAPTLRAVGIDVGFGREKTAKRRRLITIRENAGEPTVQTVQTVQAESVALDADLDGGAPLDDGPLQPWNHNESAVDGLDDVDGQPPDTSAPTWYEHGEAPRQGTDSATQVEGEARAAAVNLDPPTGETSWRREI